MKKITLTLFLTLAIFNANSQAKIKVQKTKSLQATFDCAINDSIVHASDIKNCKKLICVGEGSQYCKIISGLVSVTLKHGLKECRLNGESASKELLAALNDLASNDLSKYCKIYMENVVVEFTEAGKSPIRKKLPTSQITVKN
jgi:hypothetical protein